MPTGRHMSDEFAFADGKESEVTFTKHELELMPFMLRHLRFPEVRLSCVICKDWSPRGLQ